MSIAGTEFLIDTLYVEDFFEVTVQECLFVLQREILLSRPFCGLSVTER